MAYYQQTHDDYFVETCDDRDRLYRDQMRDQERRVKRQQQFCIAENLSALTRQEYLEDHLRHMEAQEKETLPDIASIDIQTEIQWYMRPYLLDFLSEAHVAFALLPETLFLAINLLDRYCSRRIVYKKHYQLVGCSALLIASKYGDRKDRVPTIKELKGMCCGLYEEDMFLQMEWHVLQTLNWVIGHPTTDAFLQIAVEHLPFDPEVEHLARYIAEIALYQREFVAQKPSNMARASLALARCIMGRNQELDSEWAGQYNWETLDALSTQLHRPSRILANKYSSSHFSRVANILEDFLERQMASSRVNAPPTPPSDARANSFTKSTYGGQPQTPSKRQFVPSYNNGCPTPPDTPTDQAYFSNKPTVACPQPPLTPIGMGCQQYSSNVTLPPISTVY